MSRAPETPKITNVMNVSIPKNPKGLTNLDGNENFIPVKIVLSSPSQSQ
jgi:hypothetical protein